MAVILRMKSREGLSVAQKEEAYLEYVTALLKANPEYKLSPAREARFREILDRCEARSKVA